MAARDPLDPKGLIRDCYAIAGITAGECRTIFLDWALGLPVDDDPRVHVGTMLARHADAPPDHPMTLTLQAALQNTGPARRRGGRAARVTD